MNRLNVLPRVNMGVLLDSVIFLDVFQLDILSLTCIMNSWLELTRKTTQPYIPLSKTNARGATDTLGGTGVTDK